MNINEEIFGNCKNGWSSNTIFNKEYKKYFKNIDNKKVICKLGEGIEAKIYKIKSYFDFFFAAKILNAEENVNAYENKEKIEQNFLEEYKINRIIQKNNNQYIVPACDLVNLNNNIGYLMPLADCTLEEYIMKRNITNELELFELAYSISIGVKCIHDKNYIHQDLKPNNILMYKDQPKICDFGFATKVDNKTKFGGNLGYLPPENEQNIIGFETDIWALGLTFYFLKYKKHLFKIKNKEKIIDLKGKIQNFENFQDFKNLDESNFDNLIKKILVRLEKRINLDQIFLILKKNILNLKDAFKFTYN